MSKNIEPELKKIGNYLNLEDDTVFIIPEYQRAYSWGINNCDKLWQDINEYIGKSSTESYFFGTIIINCKDSDSKLELIDGQQRTTTFLLLLKALLIRINASIGKIGHDEESQTLLRGLKERRRKIMGLLYKADAEDVAEIPDESDLLIYKKPIIINNESINELYKEELGIILQAVDYDDAESKVVHIKYKQKDNKYTNFFRNFKYFYEKVLEFEASQLNDFTKNFLDKCEIIQIKSWKVDQAITMFNSLNSAGLPLYDSDIISAQLYASANALGKGADFSLLWKTLKESAQTLEEKGLGDLDALLMQHMYYTRAYNKETITESGSVNVTTPGLRRYFIDINPNILNDPISLTESLVNLAKIWIKVSSYPLIQLLFRFNENFKLFLASYFYRFKEEDVTEELVNPIARCLLRLFAILELGDIGYSSSKFKSFLFGVEIKLADPAISIEDIEKEFNDHISNNWDEADIEEELKDYDGYSLIYLNDYIFAQNEGKPFDLSTSYDIEHIMPYSGKNLSEIRADAGIVDEDEFKGIVNKLGNKIVLEQKINRSIGNEWFRTKVSTKLADKTGYVDSKYPIASALVEHYKGTDHPYWKKADIEAATNKASERIGDFIFGIVPEDSTEVE